MIREEEKFVDELETPADSAEETQENSSDEATFNVGDIITVKATKIQPYGVFCKCGNDYAGLVHISRITHKYVKSVSDYFKEQDEFKARIINVNKEAKKLSLCTKEFRDQEDFQKLNSSEPIKGM